MSIQFMHALLKNVRISCIYYFLRVYLSLLRIKVIGQRDSYKNLENNGRIIIAIWHQRLLPSFAYAPEISKLNPCVMISRSKDGDLIAPIAKRLGLEPVRGSSSRGGSVALATLLKVLEVRQAVIHVVDGPRGPKSVVQPGIIRMAQVSGAVIIPLFVSAEKAWIMGSWDRFLVPKPFSQVIIRWGEPFSVPSDIDSETFEALRKEFETRLIDGYAKDDVSLGWKEPL